MQADSSGDEVNLTGNVLGDAWSLATESGTLVLLRVLRGCAGRVPHLDEGAVRRSLRCSYRVVTSATVPPRSWTVHGGPGLVPEWYVRRIQWQQHPTLVRARHFSAWHPPRTITGPERAAVARWRAA